ncbi:mycofactocin radical SAM maturase [Nocardia sp. NPDC050378]|uniref:mycofactocin radical SAM maturase n=1 Tax=Nocardia sp. NPDC050378 TaxID=3155400 RepID=UPI00340F7694
MAAGVLDLDARWALHPRVSLRPESFGALLYHFGTRKLSFLKSRELVDVVRSLPAHHSVREALHAKGFSASTAYVEALDQLARTDMIVPAPGPVTPVEPSPPAPVGAPQGGRLIDRFESGLAAPICLTWELTYACNLSCVHCLSSSGRRDPNELSTEQCKALIDEFERMQIFYVNIGGGEPTVRPDFWELVDYATAHHVGVKFSTNGVRINQQVAARLAASDYVDVQISLDGATAEVNDAVRGPGSYDTAIRALSNLADAGFRDAKLSVVATRHNIAQLDEFKAIADRYGATLRLTRLRPSGRGADVWDELHPLPEQQRELYDWLVRNGEGVLTGDSFFHLSAFGSALPGLNMCGAGRVVCLVDPVGDVYACPFAIHDRFKAGNILTDGGFDGVWTNAELFAELREPVDGGACTKCSHYDACRGGCMAAKFFTGLPANGPDPECVQGYGEAALSAPGRVVPRPAVDHSRPVRARTRVSLPLTVRQPPAKACNESPLG